MNLTRAYDIANFIYIIQYVMNNSQKLTKRKAKSGNKGLVAYDNGDRGHHRQRQCSYCPQLIPLPFAHLLSQPQQYLHCKQYIVALISVITTKYNHFSNILTSLRSCIRRLPVSAASQTNV